MKRVHYVYWYHLKSHSNIKTEGYVGVTCDLKTRDACHKKYNSGHGVILRNAFKKYGESAIKRTIICMTDKENAYYLEKRLRPTMNIGWNIAIGGGLPPDCTGRKHSEQTKKKISISNKGKTHPTSIFKGMTGRYTDEQRAHIGSFHKGKTISEAHIQSMRKKLSGSNSILAKPIHLVHKSNLNKVVTFGSISEAAKDLNVGYSGVRSLYQRVQKSKLASNETKTGWYCIHEDHLNDPKSAIALAAKQTAIRRHNGRRASGSSHNKSLSITLEYIDGTVKTYPCVLDAAKAINMSDATLRYHLHRTHKLAKDSSVTKSGWKIKYKGQV